jgi:type I restriction enzyme, S subunit
MNIPQLRFPKFEGTWERKTLGEVAPLQRGFDLPVDDIKKGEYPVVFSNGILKFHNEFKAKAPGVVTGRSGTIGKVTFVEKDYWPHNTALWVTDFKNNVPKFIYYFYSKYKLERLGTGSGVPTLNRNDIHIQEEYFPSPSEQTKIATFLSAVDERLQSLRKKKSLFEEYKKGVMKKLFSQELRFKDENEKVFPIWKDTKLGELTFKTGKRNKGNIQYPIYSINNNEGFLPQSEQFEGMDSNARGYDIALYKIIQKKTFAYNPARINVGSIGFSANLENIIISSLYVCFQTTEKLEDHYLLQYLKTFDFNKSVLINSEGGVRDYLFYDNFSKIRIPLPCNKEQTKIANFLSTIDEKIQLIEKQLLDIDEWKKGLMQKMFC